MKQPSISDSLKSYALSNSNGVKVKVMNYGGRIVSLFVPDRNGKFDDVVLGYDSLDQYLTGNLYFGAMIGRYGNRIAKGKFSLNGKEYHLALNNGANALHGGLAGFHGVFWKIIPQKENSLQMSYRSADGEEGYPGNLNVTVTYTLTDKNELIIDYEAKSDQETVINLTHHSFFNLAGAGNGDILNHELTINSNEFTPVDSTLIPTGEIRNVKGTAFDFNIPHKIGELINQTDEQLRFGKGYDHNWVLNKKGNELSLATKVTEPLSGRTMEVWTTEPGLQFYSGNFLDGKDVGKGNKPYQFRSAFCFEAQHFPDSPNHPDFPSTILKQGETYKQRTIYKFGIEK
ncbi:MAG: galactose mutarotase [Bacteroidetes bacterium]|nr:galactose mutarotase [Bacteroidota bacterium]